MGPGDIISGAYFFAACEICTSFERTIEAMIRSLGPKICPVCSNRFFYFIKCLGHQSIQIDDPSYDYETNRYALIYSIFEVTADREGGREQLFHK